MEKFLQVLINYHQQKKEAKLLTANNGEEWKLLPPKEEALGWFHHSQKRDREYASL